MSKSSRSPRSRKSNKPDKPYPEFPLYAHATKRWAKKVHGRTLFFGKWDDPQAALQNWLSQRDDLLAGRVPRAPMNELRVRELSDRFLTAKRRAMERGELSPRTWGDYYDIIRVIVRFLKSDRLVLDLTPDDFGRLLDKGYPKTWGPKRRHKAVAITRSLFKFASDEDLIDRAVKFGKQFKGPSKKVLRLHRAANGKLMFTAPELRMILAAAKPQLRAMTMIALNAGFGNHDVACLPQSTLDLANGWCDFARPKTGVRRRAKLWPETVEALREAIARLPKPRDPADAGLTFLTRKGGRWSSVKTHVSESGEITVCGNDALAQRFTKLLDKLGLKRAGVGFYCLRRTFATVASGSLDPVCVNAVMGHIAGDDEMPSTYRQEISDARFENVSAFVRRWLFAEEGGVA
jgi:hypothetical protein